jgi:ATP-dependent Clp protease ATP-binding subunit ClpA
LHSCKLPAERALDYAVAQSYDATYGARPLRRWLEHAIITPLSRMIISGGRYSTSCACCLGSALI